MPSRRMRWLSLALGLALVVGCQGCSEEQDQADRRESTTPAPAGRGDPAATRVPPATAPDQEEPGRPQHVAILPFVNRRPGGDVNWVGPGTAVAVTLQLAGTPQVRAESPSMIAETSQSRRLPDTVRTDPGQAAKLGRMLGADRIVLGSYSVTPDNQAFQIRVVHAETALVVHEAHAEGRPREILAVVSRLARAVVKSFDKDVARTQGRATVSPAANPIVLTPRQEKRLAKPLTASVPAYESFAKSFSTRTDSQKIAMLSKAIGLDSKFAEAYSMRGIAHHQGGQLDRAIRDFSRVIALAPATASAYGNRGLSYAEKGDHDRAIADYNHAIASQPKLAVAHYNRGNSYLAKGRNQRAIQDYTQAIALKPRYAVAYENRGSTFFTLGDTARAIQDYNRAAQIDPGNASVYKNRALLHAGRKAYDEAMRDYNKAIALRPDYASAYFERGNIHFERKRYDLAIGDYTRAVEADPKFYPAYHNRTAAYCFDKQYDKARADARMCERLGKSVHPSILKKLRNAPR